MTVPENGLTNHEVTICLAGGAVLGPFNATWSKDSGGDVRELVREYDAFLQGEKQHRYKRRRSHGRAPGVHAKKPTVQMHGQEGI